MGKRRQWAGILHRRQPLGPTRWRQVFILVDLVDFIVTAVFVGVAFILLNLLSIFVVVVVVVVALINKTKASSCFLFSLLAKELVYTLVAKPRHPQGSIFLGNKATLFQQSDCYSLTSCMEEQEMQVCLGYK